MNNKPSSIKNVLSIGGSDPSGGAGIQADLKTFAANGVYGMAVITALTAQNTLGVFNIHSIDVGFVEEQINCLFDDIQPHAVKIGMLANAAIISRVAARLKHYQARNIVVDPVMLSSSGQSLLDPSALDNLIHELLPLATLYTPNLNEGACLLAGHQPTTRSEMREMAEQLLPLAQCAVLLKGGHLPGDECPDLLLYKSDGQDSRQVKARWFTAQRIDSANNHGTGCTLSSAIAANLADNTAHDNDALVYAVAKAKNYLSTCLSSSNKLKVGSGAGPLHHFAGLWR